jgi:hypothetical protein
VHIISGKSENFVRVMALYYIEIMRNYHGCDYTLTFHSALRKLNTETSIGASHQISIHLVKQFQRRRFKEIDQPETRIAYDSHVC